MSRATSLASSVQEKLPRLLLRNLEPGIAARYLKAREDLEVMHDGRQMENLDHLGMWLRQDIAKLSFGGIPTLTMSLLSSFVSEDFCRSCDRRRWELAGSTSGSGKLTDGERQAEAVGEHRAEYQRGTC